MRVVFRKAGVACGSLAASALLAFTAAAPSWASSSVLMVGGLGTPYMADIIMAQVLGDITHGQQRVSVRWPAEAAPYTGINDLSLGESIAVGIDNLSTELDAALDRLSRDANGNVLNGEKVTVIGLSAGSLVVTEKLRLLVDDPDAPAADELAIYVVADSSRQEVIKDAKYNSQYDYTYQPAPDTVYTTMVVTAEFDGLADQPDRWWNVLAWVNAAAGAITRHIPVMFEDLDDVPEAYITTTVNELGGVTKHYLVPADELPLVTLLTFLKPIEDSLRASVERGYSRYDDLPFSTANAVAAEPVQAAQLVEEPVAEPELDTATAVETEAVESIETDVAESIETDAVEAEEMTEAEAAEAVAGIDAADEVEVVSDAADDLEVVTDDGATDDTVTDDEVDLALATDDDEAQAELAAEDADVATAKDDDEESEDADDSDAAADSGDSAASDAASDDSGSEDSSSDE